jgi:hypothetical protein
MSSLTAEVELLRTQLANVWMQLEEVRADRDRWRQQAEQAQQRLLPNVWMQLEEARTDRDHWRSAFEAQQRLLPTPAPARRSWWRWLCSTG